MASEARPAFLAITGQLEVEALAAALRFAAVVREAVGGKPLDADFDDCAALATRAFGGDPEAWAPLVLAVREVLTWPAPEGSAASRSRRELRAFVAENADLLEH